MVGIEDHLYSYMIYQLFLLSQAWPVVGIEDHFYNYMIYQLAFGLIAPVIDGGVAKIQVGVSECGCGSWCGCGSGC